MPSAGAVVPPAAPASNPLESLFAGLKIQTASGTPIPGHVLLQALLSQGQQGGAGGTGVNPALLAQIAAMSSSAPQSGASAAAQMSPARANTGLTSAVGDASLIPNLPANYQSMNSASGGPSGAFGSPMRSGAAGAAVSLSQPPPRPSRSELAFQELELFGKEVLFSPAVRGGDAAATPQATSASSARPGAAVATPTHSAASSSNNGQQSLLEF